jgi:hypothetical protein
LSVALARSNRTEANRYRTGGTITVPARHASRNASAEHARGLSSRSKHTCTSRNRGTPCPEQVATTEPAGNRGFARKNSFTMDSGDCSIAALGLFNAAGMVAEL